MQDVCLVFSLIIVFLSFFSTYVFQVSTNTRNSPPASQYYIVMNVCRLGWWGCWWPGTSCPSWCRWPTSASPSATTWPRSTRAGTSPSPTGGQISSSRSSSSTDQVESSTLQFFLPVSLCVLGFQMALSRLFEIRFFGSTVLLMQTIFSYIL